MTFLDCCASDNDQYRALFELASEGIWQCALEEPVSIHLNEEEQIAAFYRYGRFVECNPAMAAMYGLPDPASLRGARLGDLLPFDDPHNIEYLRAFIRSGYRLTDAESHERDVEGRPKHILNNLFGIIEAEHLIRVWGTQRDITRQKEIERELRRKVEELETISEVMRQSEDRFRQAFEHAPVGAAITDLEGRFLYVNPAYCRLVGYTLEELRGLDFGSLTHPDDWPDNQEAHRRLLAGEIPTFSVEKRYIHKQGHYVWVRASASVRRDAAGNPFQIVGLVEDITERKQIEATLRDREGMLRTLGDNLPGAIYQAVRAVGGPTTFRYLSAGIERLTGVPAEQILADTERLYACIAAEDLPGLAAAEDFSVRTGSPFDYQFRVRNREGQLHWIHCRAASRTLPDGTVVWDGSMMDIDAQKLATEALHEADRRKDEFLAMLAHELRNPLAPIRTSVRILELKRGDDPATARNLIIIERSVETMARLLDDLLDVSRITRGLVELRCEPLDLGNIIRQVVETARPGIESLRHSLTLRLPEGAFTVFADPVRMEQILTNLLTNAAKYTDPGGQICVSLEIEDDDLAPTAVIRVRDTGRGIPPELLPRVFDLFTQGEQGLARTQGGLGIGLTMVRRLVEMHGGRVSARSEGPGRGSEFVVRLPMPDVERGPGKSGPPTPKPRKRRTDTVGAPPEALPEPRATRVLVVDDNADAAETLVELFQLWDCEVRPALDGPAALELAASFEPDLILLDIGMPVMDGYEVARRLRTDPALAGHRPYLVALTGYGRDEDRETALNAGFDEHQTKPVNPESLLRLLRRMAPADE